ncbi:hypothetical protein EQU24_13705 [Methylotuvimicrobium buryatense]|uniref:Uncharacterized protein n=1 Tax=Methylotuvimicrobium buryatense TaxID=95641 RepID=A0A4V1IK00_METBY|nr:hypothetical protein EQU24_13705 [Methylotuvimicrobium buryatense]
MVFRRDSQAIKSVRRVLFIPIALQISALAYGGVWVFGKGFGSMDAVLEPTWTYSRRPLTGTPTPKFD